MASSSRADQAASGNASGPPDTLDPKLLMAALCGKHRRLKELLRLPNDDEEEHGQVQPAAVTAAAVILEVEVEVVAQRPPPAPAAPGSAAPAAAAVVNVDVVTEGDSLLHVVAASASGEDEEYLRCAELIVRAKMREGGAAAVRDALKARNNKGDTPLHCAARAGNADMIGLVLDYYKATNPTTTDDVGEQAEAFLRMHNYCGETALHQAVRAASKPAIDRLLLNDPELARAACSSREEDAAAAAAACSPFFLAVSLWGERDEMDIARHLFNKTRPSIRSNLSYYCSGAADERNALHAAVSRGSVEAVIRFWELLRAGGADDLLSQLASQGDKENGSTPLHLAASVRGFPSVYQLLPPQIWPPMITRTRTPWPVPGTGSRDDDDDDAAASWSAVRRAARTCFLWGFYYFQQELLMLSLVLYANVAMVYQEDKTGRYPIHVAAGSGSLHAVMTLLERCPDCATLRDGEGRTLLHVAAEEGRSSVVAYVCRQSRRRLQQSPESDDAAAKLAGRLSSILNAQDINGDTPLHRAVEAGQLAVVQCLIQIQQVRLDVHNNVGMRPIDVSWTTMPLEEYYAWDSRVKIRKSLLLMGAPYGENHRGDLLRKKCVNSSKDKEKEKRMSEELTAAAQVLALFSVLITTVTFASAFTLPGGYRSAGDGGGGVPGTPLLAGPRRSYVFDAFVLADALAFSLSLLATATMLYAGVPSESLDSRFRTINLAYNLMWHSARSLLAAFGLGLFVVLLPVARSIAIAVTVLMILIATNPTYLQSEFINSLGANPLVGIGTSRKPLRSILLVFHYFWCYILIFGLPAIRKWPRFTLSPY